MKKVIFLFFLFSTLLSCDNKVEENGILDSNARIKITGLTTKSVCGYDSIAFITRYASEFYAVSEVYGKGVRRGFDFNEYYGINRDTVNNKLLLFGIDVINGSGLGSFVVDMTDIVLVALKNHDGEYIHPKYFFVPPDTSLDTIGYIPNKTVLKARKEITEAFNKKDYEECYRLFDEAYVFIPTTGLKWREMKAAGIE